MSWKDAIANCFEPEAAGFDHHWIQAASAKAMIAPAKSQGATFEELEREIVWFCYCKVKAPASCRTISPFRSLKLTGFGRRPDRSPWKKRPPLDPAGAVRRLQPLAGHHNTNPPHPDGKRGAKKDRE